MVCLCMPTAEAAGITGCAYNGPISAHVSQRFAQTLLTYITYIIQNGVSLEKSKMFAILAVYGNMLISQTKKRVQSISILYLGTPGNSLA